MFFDTGKRNFKLSKYRWVKRGNCVRSHWTASHGLTSPDNKIGGKNGGGGAPAELNCVLA